MWPKLLVRSPVAVAGRLIAVACLTLTGGATGRAGALRTLESSPGGAPVPLLTDPAQIWPLTQEQKNSPVPIRFEGRVSFYDRGFHLFWLETPEGGTYILLSDAPPLLQTGQRVRLEGKLIPSHGLAASDVKVTVLSEREPVVPLETHGRIGDLNALGSRVVVVEAYVDGQQEVDAEHTRLSLIVDDRPVIGWVRPRHPRSVPNWTGKFIRYQALYSARFDATNTGTTIELWGEEADLTVVAALADHPRFTRAATPINQIYSVRLGDEVLVRGRVETHRAGSTILVRDDSGEILVRSVQHERLPLGTSVEVAGRVAIEGSKWVLRSAMYRRAPGAAAVLPTTADGTLTRVEQVRELSPSEAERGKPVRITGMVTWSMTGSDFFFLQDVSGGIRVRYDPKRVDAPPLVKSLEVEGVTCSGGSVPAVIAQRIVDRGSMSAPDPRPVTYEQAMAGREDGQWVEMRGFLQRTVSDGDWQWTYITTPAGEFVAHLQSPVRFEANAGSLIRVRGVCETTTDKLGQVTGVMLRVPFIHDFTVEEDAPVNCYELPEHSIKALRGLGAIRDMTRVRVVGTVAHASPGRFLFIEQDETGLTVYTRQNDALRPGDRVEIVGILGWEGPRVVLREAVYRAHGSGRPPLPLAITKPGHITPLADARLVTLRGRLIDVARHHEHVRLTLQAGSTVFEAGLDHTSTETIDPPIGAELEMTGIYQLTFDSTRQTRGFVLHLRSPQDLVVFRNPRLLTMQRALVACGVLAGVVLLGVGWITALRRRVRRQTEQLRLQMQRQSELEAEVQRATRLESLGALAGGIAHDFNNLLTIIIGNLGLAMLDTRLSESTSYCLREIERGTSRARALTRQLLTFAKGGEPVRAPVALAGIVQGAAERAVLGAAVRLRCEAAPDLWPALADKDQIIQVTHNLVINAVQASPAGGELVITLGNEEVTSPRGATLARGRYVRITVTDSGEGIPAEVLPKIFDPYFTTRKQSSGLGLATVYSIVKRHEGNIDVRSQPGEGSTFTLWLPAAQPSAAAVSGIGAAPPPATPRGGRPIRVLLMDDEASIRQVVERVLARRGILTTAVADGAAAIAEFRRVVQTDNRYDLLILDLTVPGGMGGRDVIAEVRRLDSAVPAIVSSGYSSDPVMANFSQYGFQAMVQKPYEISELVAVAERLLGRQPAGNGQGHTGAT